VISVKHSRAFLVLGVLVFSDVTSFDLLLTCHQRATEYDR